MSAEPPARLLDITRLVSRVGRGPLTGIDRVERAWMRWLSAGTEPFFLLCGTPGGGAMLLPGHAAAIVDDWLGWPDGRPPPRLRIAGALGARLAALARLAPLALRRGRRGRVLAGLPAGSAYLNLGHANLAALAAAGGAGLRRLVMVHDTIPLDFPQFASDPEGFRRRLALVARHADRVICPSAAAAADVARWCATFGRVPPIAIAPLGIEPAAPGPIPAELRRFTGGFVAVGTVEPRKNHGLLLDVWDRLATAMAEPPPLLIIGSPGWRNAAVLDRIARLPGDGPVRLATGLGDGAVSALVASARALLMPSLAEGFGLPVAEAAALGTPVVCAPLPVYREILGDIPVYVDPADLYSWTETIRTLAEQGFRRDSGTRRPDLPGWEDHFNRVSNMA